MKAHSSSQTSYGVLLAVPVLERSCYLQGESNICLSLEQFLCIYLSLEMAWLGHALCSYHVPMKSPLYQCFFPNCVQNRGLHDLEEPFISKYLSDFLSMLSASTLPKVLGLSEIQATSFPPKVWKDGINGRVSHWFCINLLGLSLWLSG